MSLDENLWAEIFDDVDQDLSLLFDPLLAEIPDIANAGHDQIFDEDDDDANLFKWVETILQNETLGQDKASVQQEMSSTASIEASLCYEEMMVVVAEAAASKADGVVSNYKEMSAFQSEMCPTNNNLLIASKLLPHSNGISFQNETSTTNNSMCFQNEMLTNSNGMSFQNEMPPTNKSMTFQNKMLLPSNGMSFQNETSTTKSSMSFQNDVSSNSGHGLSASNESEMSSDSNCPMSYEPIPSPAPSTDSGIGSGLENSEQIRGVGVRRKPKRKIHDTKAPNIVHWMAQQVCDPMMSDVICWRNFSEGTFMIKDHKRLAKLWGNFKKQRDMDYANFSRALRYHYGKSRNQELIPVPNKLIYQFSKDFMSKYVSNLCKK